jgi:hypothetical protein
MRTALLLLLALATTGLSSTTSAADVWKWVDSKGVTHYSDQPVPGATKIEVRAGNIAEARPAETVSSDTAPDPISQAAGIDYRIEIVRPQNDQAFINTSGQVEVEIRVEPPVAQVHGLSLYLDGKLVTASAPNALAYMLTGLPRGTHHVIAVIRDGTGRTIEESPTVEFTVRQESIAQPPTGPSVGNPPPKPRPRPTNSAANKLPAPNKMVTKQPSYDSLHGGGQPAIDPKTNLPVVKKPAPKPGKP